jgi:hypothetical protein
VRRFFLECSSVIENAPRISISTGSETYFDLYASDENSHEGGDPEQKYKKWLDVGANLEGEIIAIVVLYSLY